MLPTLLARINATSANLAECLERFEEMHILMFSSSDIGATAARLTAAGVNTMRRPASAHVETIRYPEIDEVRPDAEAEGRVGVVADLDPRIQATRLVSHPNSAVGIADVTLCAADGELDAVQARYERYIGRTPEQKDLPGFSTSAAQRSPSCPTPVSPHCSPVSERPRCPHLSRARLASKTWTL